MSADAILQEGLRLHQTGRLAEAEARYRQIDAQQPHYAAALHYRGLIAYQGQRYQDAVTLMQQSLALASVAAVHSNLANALAALARWGEAEAALRAALTLEPQFADAWFNLGNVLREQRRLADADAAYRRVLELKANHLGALNNLANLLHLRGQRDDAAQAFYYLGNVLQDEGRSADAANAYRQSLALIPNPGVEINLAFLTPAIAASNEEIEATRTRLFANLQEFKARDIHLADPLRYATSAIFYTGYHGHNDCELRRELAAFYLRAAPELAWTAPHCRRYTGPRGKLRVGFLSKYFYPDHPMTKLYGGIVETLDRERFEVTLFRFDPPGAWGGGPGTEVIVLPEDLERARRRIADAKLDVLFYTDIGMAPVSYFLAFARLAPVQCTTFGHPVTSGIPNVDYFLSAAELETEAAVERYSETLIRLSVVPTYFRAPRAANVAPSRGDLGLPSGAHLYLCAQNLIKLHPSFDSALAAILRRDPQALLLLIDSIKTPNFAQLLRQRFGRSMPELLARVRFLPFLKLETLLAFCREVDAVLDTPVFGGGTTSLEMFAVDTPVLTWPGADARSRITHALYRQMRFDDLSAANETQYVDLALRLASDRAWRGRLVERLRQRKAVLYENRALVRELESFFEAAVAAAAQGRKLQAWAA